MIKIHKLTNDFYPERNLDAYSFKYGIHIRCDGATFTFSNTECIEIVNYLNKSVDDKINVYENLEIKSKNLKHGLCYYTLLFPFIKSDGYIIGFDNGHRNLLIPDSYIPEFIIILKYHLLITMQTRV